jgi:hypothetical protein
MQSAASRLKRRVAETAVSLAPKDSGISRLGKSAALLKKRIAIVSAPVPARRYVRLSRRVVAKSQSSSPDRESGFHQQHEFSLMVHALIPAVRPIGSPGVGKRVVARTGTPVPGGDHIVCRLLGEPAELPMEANHHRRARRSCIGTSRGASRQGQSKFGPWTWFCWCRVSISESIKSLLPIRSRLICELGRRRPAPGQQERQPRGEFLPLFDHSAKSNGKVVILSQVQDNELAWYYQRALVTVFPVAACHLESSACPKMSLLSGGRGRVLGYCEHRMISVAHMI